MSIARSSSLRSSSGQRGFTLTELMAVVVITGILAAVGTTMFRAHILASRTIETTSMIRSIAAAQERFRGENLTYFDVSNGNLAAYYPSPEVGSTKYDWVREHAHGARWALLNPTVPGPVQYGYACIAGGPGTGIGVPAALQIAADWPTNFTMPWYVIQAIGDVDEDGVPSYYVGASYTSQIFSGGDPE